MKELKLTHNTSYLTYDIFMDFLFVVLLASGYVEHIGVWRKLCVVVFAAATVLYLPSIYEALSQSKRIVLSGLCISLLLMICIISSVSDANTITNIKGLIYAFCPAATLIILAGDGIPRFKKYLNSRAPLLNAVYVINLYVLSRQIQGTGFMIKSSWLAQNSYYKDQCSGIFGFNSTHSCGLFSIFMLLLNLHCLSFCRNKIQRLLFSAYTLLTEAVMIYCAAHSDNMALYVLTPFFLVLYYYLSGREVGIITFIRNHYKQLILITVICVLASMALLSNAAVSDFAGKIYDRIYRTIFFNEIGVKGSNERLAIIAEALSAPFGWLFGYGIGEHPWKGLDILGYRHFGLSSIGSTIYLCGIWTFTAMTVFYIYLSTYAVERSAIAQRFLFKFRLVSALSLLILTIYTTIFIDIRKLLLFLLTMTVMQFRTDNPDSEQIRTDGDLFVTDTCT